MSPVDLEDDAGQLQGHLTAQPNGHARWQLAVVTEGVTVQVQTYPATELQRLIDEECMATGPVAAAIQLRSDGDRVEVRFVKIPEGFVTWWADRDAFAELVRSLEPKPMDPTMYLICGKPPYGPREGDEQR